MWGSLNGSGDNCNQLKNTHGEIYKSLLLFLFNVEIHKTIFSDLYCNSYSIKTMTWHQESNILFSVQHPGHRLSWLILARILATQPRPFRWRAGAPKCNAARNSTHFLTSSQRFCCTTMRRLGPRHRKGPKGQGLWHFIS